MRLVDTSVWIEVLIGSNLGRDLASALPPDDEWIVPTIIQHELAKWLIREVGRDEAERVIAFTQTCVVVDLDTSIALAAVDFVAEYGLATADSIIYATARARDAELLTCDGHFDGLPYVSFRPKPPLPTRRSP